MFVTADYDMCGDVKNPQEFFDNVRTNIIVIIESFITLDNQTKDVLRESVELKKYTDYAGAEYSFAVMKEFFDFAKKVVPQHKAVLEKLLQGL